MNKLVSLIEQRVPIRYIEVEQSCLTYESQIDLLKYLEPVIQLNASYVKNFLKKYISDLESSNEETSDELYELFVDPRILNAKELGPETPDVIKYHISGFNESTSDEHNYVLIKETPRLISGTNTTGLRTWEAALFLSNYLNDKSNMVYNLENKTILELGCGTGLISMSLSKNYHNKTGSIGRIIMTDGSSNVFDNMKETLTLNNLVNSELIILQQLIWGEETSLEDVDVILGADITYDTRILTPLCITISQQFEKSLKLCLIAATVRNTETLKQWEIELEKWFPMRWRIATVFNSTNLVSNCWFDKNTPDIKLYEITK